jgi:hypothetical protein
VLLIIGIIDETKEKTRLITGNKVLTNMFITHVLKQVIFTIMAKFVITRQFVKEITVPIQIVSGGGGGNVQTTCSFGCYSHVAFCSLFAEVFV